MSNLEALEAELASAQRVARAWVFSFVGFLFLALLAKFVFDTVFGVIAAVLMAVFSWIGGLVSALRESKAFHEYWSAAGLTPNQINLKWRELYPGD